jgi:hypothetical protein
VSSTLAYGLNIPLANSEKKDWIKEGIAKIIAGKNDRIAIPKYGAEPNITKPKN